LKSSHSNPNGACVEVALAKDGSGDVVVWHSRHLSGPCIRYTKEEWEAFVKGVKDYEFDHDRLPQMEHDDACPTCGKAGAEECVTSSGRPYGISHAQRWPKPEYGQRRR
jgi:Domain of unknown function (DUF397)